MLWILPWYIKIVYSSIYFQYFSLIHLDTNGSSNPHYPLQDQKTSYPLQDSIKPSTLNSPTSPQPHYCKLWSTNTNLIISYKDHSEHRNCRGKEQKKWWRQLGGTRDRSSSKDSVKANAMHQRNSAAYAGCTQAYGGALVVVVKGAGRNLE